MSTNPSLVERIRSRDNGIVLYGMVPPKATTEPEQTREIAARQRDRIAALPVDGVVLYDLQDEAERTDSERPFPFIETLDPFQYGRDHLDQLDLPRIVYRAVGKHGPDGLRSFLSDADPARELTVFVGAASRDQNLALSMNDAYRLRREVDNAPLLGGVVIPERHRAKGTEHLRVLDKVEQGCEFFISQGVYNVQAAKDLLSDLYYASQDRGIEPPPILFTLTPCGSVKTLEFMKWLGISIPRWLENDLVRSGDILEQSVEISERIYRELADFAAGKDMVIGCNIESVSVRKVEVDAAVDLLKRLA